MNQIAKNALLFFVLVTFLAALKLGVERFVDLSLPQYSHKTKSFDAERQMPPELAWSAQPSKSFDAEREALVASGGNLNAGFLAKTIKYY